MTTVAVGTETFIPEAHEAAEVLDFVAAMKARGLDAPTARPRLVGADGAELELPEELFRVLKFAAEALSEGQAVAVAPLAKQLTTQQAAEFLGISRPSLIKLLERAEIPHTLVGRHRKVILRDLVSYQTELAKRRAAALTEMVRIAEEHHLYELTAVPFEEPED